MRPGVTAMTMIVQGGMEQRSVGAGMTGRRWAGRSEPHAVGGGERRGRNEGAAGGEDEGGFCNMA